MNYKLLFQTVAIFGAIAVGAALFALRSNFLRDGVAPVLPPETNAIVSAPGSDQQAAHEREQIAKLQADNEMLLAKLQTLTASNQAMAETIAQKAPGKSKAAANPFAAMFGGGGDGDTNGMGGAMQQLIKSQLEQQTEGKISRMKTRLQLTPEQEQKVRDSMGKANEQMMAMTQKMYSGDAKPEDVKDLSSTAAAGPQVINEILTPEQQTEYAVMQKEELQNNARLMANAEMLQLQGSLGLSQEQQDKVFGVLYQQTLDTTSGATANPVAAATADPTAAMQQALDKKIEALTPILTPDQLKSYRDLQEQQLKLIQAFIPKVSQPAPPTAVAVPKP